MANKESGEFNKESDPQASNVASLLYRKSIAWAKFHNSTGESVQGWILMAKGRLGVTTGHIVEKLKGVSHIDIFHSFGNEPEYKTHRIMKQRVSKDRDLFFFELEVAELFKDITHFMRSRTKPLDCKIVRPVRCTFDFDSDTTQLIAGTYLTPVAQARMTDGTSYDHCLVAVDCEGGLGECGLPYLLFNTSSTTKIEGLHQGSGRQGSIIMPIYQEDFSEIEHWEMTEADEIFEKECFKDLEVKFSDTLKKFPGMRYYGEINKTPSQIQKTNIEKTVYAAGVPAIIDGKRIWLEPPEPVLQAPAILRKTVEGKDPHKLAYRKLKGHVIKPPPKEMENNEVYNGTFSKQLDKHNVRMLTIEEAVFGSSDLGIPPIDLDTCTGFPWKLYGITRRMLIDPVKRIIDPRLRRAVEHLRTMSILRKVVMHVTMHQLKDETRELSRVLEAYTRAYQMGSLHHLIFHRMSFGFFVFETEHNKDSDISVGLNPYSIDWDLLAQQLSVFSDIIAHDVSGWDLNFPYWFAYFLAGQTCQRYGISHTSDHGRCILASYIQTVMPIVLMPDGTLWYALIMASGTFGTSFVNSSFNSVKTRVILRRALLDAGYLPPVYDEILVNKNFGDDNTISSSKTIQEVFNGVILARLAKELFNHTHTDPMKGNNIQPSMKLEQAVYLCRGFKRWRGYWVGPLNESSSQV